MLDILVFDFSTGVVASSHFLLAEHGSLNPYFPCYLPGSPCIPANWWIAMINFFLTSTPRLPDQLPCSYLAQSPSARKSAAPSALCLTSCRSLLPRFQSRRVQFSGHFGVCPRVDFAGDHLGNKDQLRVLRSSWHALTWTKSSRSASSGTVSPWCMDARTSGHRCGMRQRRWTVCDLMSCLDSFLIAAEISSLSLFALWIGTSPTQRLLRRGSWLVTPSANTLRYPESRKLVNIRYTKFTFFFGLSHSLNLCKFM